jgi:hypothetical protein
MIGIETERRKEKCREKKGRLRDRKKKYILTLEKRERETQIMLG